jgi:hypothetical protein
MRLSRTAFFAAWSDARETRIFVSKKLPGIRFLPVEFEVPRQPTSIGAQLVQKSLSAWLPRNAELTGAGDMNFNFIAFLEPQGLHHWRRKADGETVAPFCNLHQALLRRASLSELPSAQRIESGSSSRPPGFWTRGEAIQGTWAPCVPLDSFVDTLLAMTIPPTPPHARGLRIREGPSSIFCLPASSATRRGFPRRRSFRACRGAPSGTPSSHRA